MKRLENKVVVIYSDGTIGGLMAKAFAREGAVVPVLCKCSKT